MVIRSRENTSKRSKIQVSNNKNDHLLSKNKISTSRVTPTYDIINIQIIEELLKNPDVSSSDISNRLKVPLSTIQRRHSRIEKSSMVSKRYEIDHKQLALRKADILVAVSKGDCIEIAQRIVKEHPSNILEVTVRIGDPQVNLMALVVYNDSNELFEILQNIRRMEHVESVEWSEIVRTVIKNDSGIMQNLLSKLVNKQ